MTKNPVIDVKGLIHIALVVENVHKAAEAWSRWLGIPVDEMNIRVKGNTSVGADARNHYRNDYNYGLGEEYAFTEADIDLSAMRIELIEPEKGNGPFREYYKKHGTGIHHIAFRTDNFEEAERMLLERGYDYIVDTYSANGDRWTVFDTEDILGTNLCIKPPEKNLLEIHSPKKVVSMQKGENLVIDGSGLIHIALVVNDVYKAAKEWGRLLGEEVGNMRIRPKGNNQRNPGSRDLRNRYRENRDYGNGSQYEWIEADVHANGFLIELNQPDKEGPFQEYYRKHGTGIQHIAFRVGDKCDALNDLLEEEGYPYIVDTYAPNKDRWPVHDTEDVMGTNLCVKPGLEFLTGGH